MSRAPAQLGISSLSALSAEDRLAMLFGDYVL